MKDDILKIFDEHDSINSIGIPDFSVIVNRIKQIQNNDNIFNSIFDIAFGKYPSVARSTAIGVLYELDGKEASKIILSFYLDNKFDRTWLIQMSARTHSVYAAKLLESLIFFEDDDENRAEIVDSLGKCGDQRSLLVLETVIKWDKGYSWDNIEIKNIAIAAIQEISQRII